MRSGQYARGVMTSELPAPSSTSKGIGTVALVIVGALFDVCAVSNVPGAAVFTAGAVDGRVTVTGLGTALAFVGILAWISLLWGHRVPVLPFVAGGVLAVIGVSYLLLVVAGVGLVRRNTGRLRLVALLVSSLVAAFVLREVLTPWGSGLAWFFGSSHAASPSDPGWNVATVVIALVSLGVAAAVLALSQTRDRAHRSELRVVAESRRAEGLYEETVRQAERERIARDMHDALAHRLSVVSLHAGALEAVAPVGEAGQMARTVREQTHAALQDMRGLIGDLRSAPVGAPGPPATMRAMGSLVTGIRSAGHPITSDVLVESVERAGALLDGAVYRIVQEAITNALKHAPGAPVDVYVRVNPADGARIRVVNPLGVPPWTEVPGGRNGVLGIRERAAALDGAAWIGSHEGSFIVDVTMPWQERG